MVSDISEAALTQQIELEISALISADILIAQLTRNDRERDAFTQSNAVAPDYLEVDIP